MFFCGLLGAMTFTRTASFMWLKTITWHDPIKKKFVPDESVFWMFESKFLNLASVQWISQLNWNIFMKQQNYKFQNRLKFFSSLYCPTISMKYFFAFLQQLSKFRSTHLNDGIAWIPQQSVQHQQQRTIAAATTTIKTKLFPSPRFKKKCWTSNKNSRGLDLTSAMEKRFWWLNPKLLFKEEQVSRMINRFYSNKSEHQQTKHIVT